MSAVDVGSVERGEEGLGVSEADAVSGASLRAAVRAGALRRGYSAANVVETTSGDGSRVSRVVLIGYRVPTTALRVREHPEGRCELSRVSGEVAVRVRVDVPEGAEEAAERFLALALGEGRGTDRDATNAEVAEVARLARELGREGVLDGLARLDAVEGPGAEEVYGALGPTLLDLRALARERDAG